VGLGVVETEMAASLDSPSDLRLCRRAEVSGDLDPEDDGDDDKILVGIS
jgi:hypothetical protein